MSLDQLKPKTTRYPDGASVMEHVIKGKGNEIGFGAITEIKMYEPKGLKLIGPLPADAGVTAGRSPPTPLIRGSLARLRRPRLRCNPMTLRWSPGPLSRAWGLPGSSVCGRDTARCSRGSLTGSTRRTGEQS